MQTLSRQAGIADGWLMLLIVALNRDANNYEQAKSLYEHGKTNMQVMKHEAKLDIVAKAKELYEDGNKIVRVAEKLNVSPRTIHTWKNNGWIVKKRGAKKKGVMV